MRLKVIIPPATEPLTLEEAKTHLGITGDYNDPLIAGAMKQAAEYCEKYQNKKYITQTLEAYLDYFPSGSIEFRNCSPVQSIETIKYITSDGTEHTVDAANYSLDNVSFVHKIDLAYGASWPSVTLKPTNGVIIKFVAGYGLSAVVPQSVKWAMAFQTSLLHDNHTPQERDRLERARDALLSIDRVVPV